MSVFDIIPTGERGVALVKEQGRYCVITGVGTFAPVCDCPRALRGRSCPHIKWALEFADPINPGEKYALVHSRD